MNHWYRKVKVGLVACVFFMLSALSVKAQIIWQSATGSGWLTGSNWVGGAVPGAADVAQFNTNPTSATTGIGVHMDSASGAVTVGAIYLSSVRTNNLIIGNSSPSTSGILTLMGDTVSGIANVYIANLSSNSSTLALRNTQGSGGSTLGIQLGGRSGRILAGSGTITNIGNTIHITSQITGSAALQFLGNGTWNATGATGVNGGVLRLGANNTFSGGITVGDTDGSANGILQLDSPAAIQNITGNDITINPNSQMLLSAPNGSSYTASNYTLILRGLGNNYSSTGKGALINSTGNTYNWAGPIQLASDAAITVAGTNTASVTLTGNVTGSGQLIKHGGGTLVLSGNANSWSGGTAISNGRILVNSASNISSGPLAMHQQTGNPSLVLNNTTQVISKLSSHFTSATANNIITLNGTRLIIQQDSNSSYGGVSSNQYSIINGNGSVIKRGVGTLTLTSAAHTFTGGLKISDGTLRFNPTYNATATFSAPDTLDGGSISTVGINRGFTYSLGTLCLSENSQIELGTDTAHSLKFADSRSISWASGKILTIYNWLGGYNSSAGTKGKLFIGTSSAGLTPTQLAQIKFIDAAGNTFDAFQLSTGEIVPKAAIIVTTSALFGPYCNHTAHTITVSFSATGTLTGIYKVQLSGPTGVFATDSTTNIIGSGFTSPITAVIPVGFAAGTAYRIRVINTRPALIFGTNNGSNITVIGTPAGGTITGPSLVSVGGTGNYGITITGGTWTSADTAIASISTTGVATGRSVGATTLSYTVTNSCALSSYSMYAIQVARAPIITSVTPSEANVGSSITITGNYFNPTTAANIVYFGSVKATVTAASTTSLTVVAPPYSMLSAITVTDTTTGLSCASTMPFIPTFNNTGLMTDSVNLKPPVSFNLGVYPVGIAAGDLDNDGKADFIVANSTPNNIYIFRNTGSAGTIATSSFATPLILSTQTSPYYVKTGDIDGDGKLDVIVGSAAAGVSRISIFRNISTSSTLIFATRVDINCGAGAPIDFNITDIDIDGKPDLVIINQTASRIAIIKNNTTKGIITASSFTNPVYFTTGTYPFRMSVGDIDGDGKPDVAVTNFGSNSVSVFRNTTTTGTINSSSLSTPLTVATDGGPAGIAIGDIDEDGKPELLVINSSVNSLSIFKNTSTSGSLSFASNVDFTTPSIPADISLADMDGDGKLDPVISNYYGNNISVYLNRASTGAINTTSLMAPKNFAAGLNATGIVTTDFDGDGKADVGVVNGYSSTVFLYKNYPLPPIGTTVGPDTLCIGSTVTYTNSIAGGGWQLSNTSIATVSAAGVVTALASGSDTLIYYTIAQGDTNFAYFPITLLPVSAVAPITASSTTVCAGTIINLYNSSAGGTWSSADTTIATVSGSGIVTGRSVGSTVVTYSVSNFCSASFDTIAIQVNPSTGYTIGAISGTPHLCRGTSYTFTDTSLGGTWSTDNAGIATVTSTGIVNATGVGTTTISYGFSGTCGAYLATFNVTTDSLLRADSIYAPHSICIGIPVTLYAYGTSGGVWSLTNPAASITASGIITGITAGVDTIVYTVSNLCNTAIARKTITINPAVFAGTITGRDSVCIADTIVLRGATPGGRWIRSNSSASLFAAGADTVNIIGNTAGIDTFRYIYLNLCGTDTVTKIIKILPLPNPGFLNGAATVCIGNRITLRATVGGGVWSHFNNNTLLMDSVVTGSLPGADTIVYTVSSSIGCGVASVRKTINVYAFPVLDSITGLSTVCVGDSIQLFNTTTGGVWSRTNPKLNISTTGKVKGVSGGLDTVRYTVTQNGCVSVVSKQITVNPLPTVAAITGATTVCVGSRIAIKNATTGGVWYNTGNYSTLTDTVLTGNAVGSDTISYAVTNSCGTTTVTKKITVNAQPYAAPIVGDSSLFVGDTIILTNSSTGGTWLSTTKFVKLNNSGYVGGLKAGTDTILYVITNSCGKDTATFPILVLAPNNVGAVSNFSVYPNPGSGRFTVTLESRINEKAYLLLSDPSFQTFKLLTINTNEPTIVNLDMPNGVYLFSAIVSGTWYTVKVVVSR